MNKRIKGISNKRKKYSTSIGIGIRSVCAVLCMLMILFCFVGCDSYATAEEMSSLKASLEEASTALEALKGEHATAQEELQALKDANQAATEELDALTAANTEANQKIEQLQTSATDAKNEITTLKNDQATLKGTNDTLQETNDTLQKEIEALKGAQTAAQDEIKALKEVIEHLQDTGDSESEKIKIYVDQGHNPSGMHNAGAEGNDLCEQDLTFAVGTLLAELLKADGRFDVCLSRPTAGTVLGTDKDSSLDARVQGAADFGADYFISLHTNAHESSSPNGIEVYVAEENSESYFFGNTLLQGMLKTTELSNRGMKLGSNLRVLKNATMPAALLEMGFITNEGDATMLSKHPDRFAQGIYEGILAYFGLTPPTPANS